MIKPFKTHTAPQIIDALKQRLRNTRWPDEIEGSGWAYGANLSYLKTLADYWLNEYSWEKTKAEMPAGGHFAAAEQPELLSDDLVDFFKALVC